MEQFSRFAGLCPSRKVWISSAICNINVAGRLARRIHLGPYDWIVIQIRWSADSVPPRRDCGVQYPTIPDIVYRDDWKFHMSWFIRKWNFRSFQIRINFYDFLPALLCREQAGRRLDLTFLPFFKSLFHFTFKYFFRCQIEQSAIQAFLVIKPNIFSDLFGNRTILVLNLFL